MASAESIRASLRLTLGRSRVLLCIVAVLIGGFLLIPILVIFPMALTSDTVLTWPPDLVSLRWFEAFFESRVWRESLERSVRIAVPVALAATVVGTLAAFGSLYARRWRRLLQTLFIAPLVLPLISYALGLYDVSARLDLIGSRWPVMVGQTMLAVPLVFVIVSAGLARRDPKLPQAAASLGAPARTIIWRIEIPLVRGSIAAGGMVALVYSFDEIIIAHFLLPPGGGTLPVQMLGATREAHEPIIAAAAVVVITFAALAGALALVVRTVWTRSAP